MFLFKISLSRSISNSLFSFAKMVNSSKDGMLLQFKRWLLIALSFDGLVFLNAKADIPICSLRLSTSRNFVIILVIVIQTCLFPVNRKKMESCHFLIYKNLKKKEDL